jgi:hypothetical protein
MSNYFVQSIASGISTLVSLAFHGIVLTITLTHIRRYRPEATLPMAVSASIALAMSILLPVAYALVPVLLRSLDTSDMPLIYAAITIGQTLVYLVSDIFFILALLALAKPAPEAEATGA